MFLECPQPWPYSEKNAENDPAKRFPTSHVQKEDIRDKKQSRVARRWQNKKRYRLQSFHYRLYFPLSISQLAAVAPTRLMPRFQTETLPLFQHLIAHPQESSPRLFRRSSRSGYWYSPR